MEVNKVLSFSMFFMSAPFLSTLLIYSLCSFDSASGHQAEEVGWKYLKHLFNAIVKLCSAGFKNGYKIMPGIYMASCWLFNWRLLT